MPGPKYDFGKSVIPVGLLGSSGSWIESWHFNALMVSEGHCPTRTLRGSRSGQTSSGYGDSTGNFYVWKRKVAHTGGMSFTYTTNSDGTSTHLLAGVAGALSTRAPSVPADLVPTFSTATAGLSDQYATGYARARPGNPVASLGQFVAELRDLPTLPFRSFFLKPGRNRRYGPLTIPIWELPKRLRERALTFKNLGSEYLNYVFGWKPFVSDVQKMYYLWHDIDRRMAQLIRENGKKLTRRATVSRTSTLERGPSSNNLQTVTQASSAKIGDPLWSTNWPYPFHNVFGAPGSSALNRTESGKSSTTVTRKTDAREWFVGKFQYAIPDTSSSEWNRSARLALFGGIPTPELLWELTPWSWLIDWFSNVGDVVSNASVNAAGTSPALWSSGIHRESTEVIECRQDTHLSEPWHPTLKWKGGDFTFTSTQTTYSKARIGGGNPFGLSVKLPDLSGGQLAILAALGISRSKVK